MNIYREQKRKMKWIFPLIAVTTLLAFVVLLVSISSAKLVRLDNITTAGSRGNSNGCLVSFGDYHGNKYKSTGTIGDGKCLVQSKWMQVMQHKVQLDEKTLIDDWLFIDYHDRINVLVEDPKNSETETKFLIFRQTKYALEDRQSLAIVGGIIEPSENARDAAAREVNEELGLDCQFEFLGRFRTDVNRGMGWVNSFIAHTCEMKSLDKSSSNSNIDPSDEVGALDTEQQDVSSMSFSDVLKNVKQGEFLEVQWSNTVALAMLHDRYKQ